jgi:hypothetical protein
MKIYVKELSKILTEQMVCVWIKSNISTCIYNGEYTSYEDYVIISKYDEEKSITGDATVLIYEDFFELFAQKITAEIDYNYDYYYLDNAINEAKKRLIITLCEEKNDLKPYIY